MIFLSVGTSEFEFNRLLKIIDELCDEKILNGDFVFAQTGYSTYIPNNYKYKDFITKEEMEKYMDECEFLIIHSGVGTITKALSKSKKIIVFPRLKKFGEHVDDHQIEIAKSFEKKGYIKFSSSKKELVNCIREINEFSPKKLEAENNKISEIINDYLNCIERKINNEKP